MGFPLGGGAVTAVTTGAWSLRRSRRNRWREERQEPAYHGAQSVYDQAAVGFGIGEWTTPPQHLSQGRDRRLDPGLGLLGLAAGDRQLTLMDARHDPVSLEVDDHAGVEAPSG